MYSFGGILVFLFSGRMPFGSVEDGDFKEILQKVNSFSDFYPEDKFRMILSHFQEIGSEQTAIEIINLIQDCMKADMSKRPFALKAYQRLKCIRENFEKQ
jgi:hypothetical protein